MGRKPKEEPNEPIRSDIDDISVLGLLVSSAEQKKFTNLAIKLGVGNCQLVEMLMKAAIDGKVKFKKITRYEIGDDN